MWSKFYEIVRLMFNFSEELQRNRSDIEKLQQEVRDLASAMQRLAYEVLRQRENEAHEREMLALRLENALLRSGRL
jgi:hypothetical protein